MIRTRTTPRALPCLALACVLASPLVATETRAETGAEPDRDRRRVALLPLWGVVVGDAEMRNLERDLAARVKALPGVHLLPRDEVADHLKAARSLGLGCDNSDVECFVKVGALAGADHVVAGFSRPAEEGLHLELRLVDVEAGAELRRADKVLRRGKAAKDLRDVVTRLLAPKRYTGRLALDIEPRGARVIVDGLLRGQAPLRAPLDLSAGFHRVRVELDGHVPFEEAVEIPFDDTLSLTMRLSPGLETAPGARRFRVLVMDPVAHDTGVPNPRTLASVIAVELSSHEHFEVVSGADLKQLAALETERQAAGCVDASCLAEIAGALGANLVVFGDVGRLGDLVLVNVSLFDSESARSLGRASVRTASVEQLPAEVAAATRDLADRFLQARGLAPAGAPEQDPAAPDTADAPLAILPWGVASVGGVALAGGATSAIVFGASALEAWSTYLFADVKTDPTENARYLTLKRQFEDEALNDELTYTSLAIAGVGAAALAGGLVWGALTPAETLVE